jgi:ribosomal protein S18 acetylase RimI-like enzyme
MRLAATYTAFDAGAVGALAELQARYVAQNPGAVCVPAEFYLSPYFGGGENVRCAWNERAELLAYAVFFAQNELAWVEIRCQPGEAGLEEVRDTLFAWLWERAVAGGQEQLAFQYLPGESEAIAYALARGSEKAYSIYRMARDLSQPIPDCPLPGGFTLRRWRMETLAEQQAYVAARNACFPEAPTTIEEWQYFCTTPLWQQGRCIAGFAGEDLAGGVTVFWEPDSAAASTEYIFTRQEYRGRGLARALVAEALRYAKEQGRQAAVLEVRAENEQALGLYLSQGYCVVLESWVLITRKKLS